MYGELLKEIVDIASKFGSPFLSLLVIFVFIGFRRIIKRELGIDNKDDKDDTKDKDENSCRESVIKTVEKVETIEKSIQQTHENSLELFRRITEQEKCTGRLDERIEKQEEICKILRDSDKG